MTDSILYGIKNCDSCKKARQWLEQQGFDYSFHDFREDGLSQDLLNDLEARIGWETMLNRSSTSWRQLDDDQKSGLNRDRACALMQAKPTLIKRPILIHGEHYLVGFKADRYQAEL